MVYKTSLLYKSFFSIAIIAFSLLLGGCGDEKKQDITEGVVNYKVTYPGRTEGGLLDGVLPKEMVMSFKDDKYANEISAAGMFDSKILVDCKKKTVSLTFHFGGTKIFTTMNESVADSLMHAQFGIPTLIDVAGIEEVATTDCKRSFAMFDSIQDGPDFEVKYTTDIKINNPNWCNQFKELNAVLMEYELKQYGMRLKMRANQLSTDPVDDAVFKIDDDYTEVSVAHIVEEFEKVFENF